MLATWTHHPPGAVGKGKLSLTFSMLGAEDRESMGLSNDSQALILEISYCLRPNWIMQNDMTPHVRLSALCTYVYPYSTAVTAMLCNCSVSFRNNKTAPLLRKMKACICHGQPPLYLAMAFRRVFCSTGIACTSPYPAYFKAYVCLSKLSN